MVKIDKKSIVVIVVAILLIWFLFFSGSSMTDKKSKYTLDTSDYADFDMSNTNIDLTQTCAMKSGMGLSSSLLPREVATQDDFGQFAPDDILQGQNFLDPRSQIGWPETIGGTLRNGNQSERAEPPNPKMAYTWNNSTIVPDLMQRALN
jgi:hypothetical protein